MAKILVVDDEVLRRDKISEVIKSVNASDEIDLASTFESGLSKIINEKYDAILLDHDLGTPDEKKTGYVLANEIVNSINRHSVIVVTSLNPVGVSNILSVIPNGIQCPVYLISTQWKVIRREFLK